MSNNDLVIVTDIYLVHQTEAAYLVRDEMDEESWIPKSEVAAIEFGRNITSDDDEELKEINSLEIPRWIAEQKGLI